MQERQKENKLPIFQRTKGFPVQRATPIQGLNSVKPEMIRPGCQPKGRRTDNDFKHYV